jgi:hypothetical protein
MMAVATSAGAADPAPPMELTAEQDHKLAMDQLTSPRSARVRMDAMRLR